MRKDSRGSIKKQAFELVKNIRLKYEMDIAIQTELKVRIKKKTEKQARAEAAIAL